ncbi:MAG: 50S ribosomal protein L29 [Dehalococcoidia bacterium]|nr:MAG: 50S ribosomal protein L29 [Dehalococcoidia bacterium]
MKAKEVKVLSDEDLKKEMEATQKEYFDLRFKAATKQLKNHRDIPKAKKTIARIKTEIRQRQLEEGESY